MRSGKQSMDEDRMKANEGEREVEENMIHTKVDWSTTDTLACPGEAV